MATAVLGQSALKKLRCMLLLDRRRARFCKPELCLATAFFAYRIFHSTRTFETGSAARLANKESTEDLELLPPSLFVTYGAIAVWTILKVTAEVFDISPLKTCEEVVIDSWHQGRNKVIFFQERCDGLRKFAAFVGVSPLDGPNAELNIEVSAKPKQPFLFGLAHLSSVNYNFPSATVFFTVSS